MKNFWNDNENSGHFDTSKKYRMCANAEHFNGFFEIYLFIFLSFAGRSPESATENSGSSFGGLGFFSYLCALSAKDCSHSAIDASIMALA